MKNKRKRSEVRLSAATLLAIIFLSLGTSGYAQSKLELSIGDAAPSLAYSKWIKGTPINSFTGDKVYVLEFWATWCKPCIVSMPHLSELAEKYADKMKVIGVNISERTGDKPYESSLPMVEAFVDKNAENMRFDVIADNNQRQMYNDWMKKAEIVGIPATILVKNNQILWIGHPAFLDKVLIEIFENTYDISLRKKDYEKSTLASISVRDKYNTHIKKIDSALAKKDYKSAVFLTDEAIRSDTATAFQYKLKKLRILLIQDDTKAVNELLNNTSKENKGQGLALAGYIANQQNLQRNYNLAAIQVIRKSLTTNSYYLDLMASMQNRTGDHLGAASTQERALAVMKENEAKSPGKIAPETFAEFENKIQKYKQAARK